MKRFNLSRMAACILAMALLVGCEPPGPAASPVEAVNRFRSSLELPISPLESLGADGMANSPTGRLPVVVYQDAEGRKFSVDPVTNLVVEMDARNLLPAHGSVLPPGAALGADALRLRAMKYVRANIPDFAALEGGLRYEEGAKGDNYFFSWYGEMTAGAMNRPFAQVGIHASGLVFAFYNTLTVER